MLKYLSATKKYKLDFIYQLCVASKGYKAPVANYLNVTMRRLDQYLNFLELHGYPKIQRRWTKSPINEKDVLIMNGVISRYENRHCPHAPRREIVLCTRDGLYYREKA